MNHPVMQAVIEGAQNSVLNNCKTIEAQKPKFLKLFPSKTPDFSSMQLDAFNDRSQ